MKIDPPIRDHHNEEQERSTPRVLFGRWVLANLYLELPSDAGQLRAYPVDFRGRELVELGDICLSHNEKRIFVAQFVHPAEFEDPAWEALCLTCLELCVGLIRAHALYGRLKREN